MQSLITGGPPTTQPPTIAVVDTGEPTRVNGYPCVRHEVRRDGVKIRDVWITDWGNVDGGWEIAAVFTAMAQFVQNINQSLPAGSGNSFEDNIFASLRDINGFPVASRDYMPDGNTKIETTLRGTTLHPLSPATFLPPPGTASSRSWPPELPIRSEPPWYPQAKTSGVGLAKTSPSPLFSATS